MFAFKCWFFIVVGFTFMINFVGTDSPDDYTNEEENNALEMNATQWANDIGEKLWWIGSNVTRLNNIRENYIEMKATVQVTDGYDILKTIVHRMNRMIKEKVDAVQRIKNATVDAESKFVSLNDERENIPYRSSKFSNVTTDSNINVTKYDPPEGLSYTEMVLNPDPHFNNVLVNTSYSSVHVPTNIYDRWNKVIEPIYWSENLDSTFIENYQNDPSLMWQYYASMSGFLRHYPAFHWSMEPDKYDCRKRIWYVQAATCSKEVIILIDNSGTMSGMRNTIAQLTVDSLLQTFSNNDYVNVFQLNEKGLIGLVDCINDTLVQATPENVGLFKQSLYDVCPGNKTNFVKGFSKAFQMLYDFIQTKSEQSERRNQAIFLLTDLLPPQNELESIRKTYESIYNGTNIQVDLFIYFIGKDVPTIRTVQWEKCLQNGSIVHVRTMDEVPEDALKYLAVIARTQNENTKNYPVSWTHAFLDIKRNKNEPANPDDHPEYGNLIEPFIMTSITTPVYSTELSKRLMEGKEEMIGVAAIDVPVSDFEKLIIPHKIGVNGYAFIVTNNGYLLLHPELTPVKDGGFRENFNSVDLTEVEFYDDNVIEPRQPHKKIIELREKMINQENGTMENLKIKFHYDNQKRVGSELRNYYYAPLKCSPFTLGLVLPRGYGNYWIRTEDGSIESIQKEKNYAKYFVGNWNIHPKWTYCDFRNKEKYAYSSPKKKLEKFLGMIFEDENFTWYEEHKNNTDESDFTDSFDECFANATNVPLKGDYFCDRELMEVFSFDAKLTYNEFREDFDENDIDHIIKSNGIQMKFVSTQSGLTRWKYFDKAAESRNFGETNNKALDEVWYKSAVLLHQVKSENFVFSLPKTDGNSTYLTVSHAIFHTNGSEHEAPGVVVGYEMLYENFKKLIQENTSCGRKQLQHYDCYIIDANGYVIYSYEDFHLGKFLGEITSVGAVMEQMIQMNSFRKISMFDYQALENETKPPTPSKGSFLFNPLNHLIWTMQWMFSKILWILLETNLWPQTDALTFCHDKGSNTTDGKTPNLSVCKKAPKKFSDTCGTREIPPHILREEEDAYKTGKKSVDKRFFLYLFTNLSSHDFHMDSELTENCSRPFKAKRINSTNLILILVDPGYQGCVKTLSLAQEVIVYQSNNSKYGEIPACNKKLLSSFPRKKLRGCSDKSVVNATAYEPCGANQFFNFGHNFFMAVLCHCILLLHYLRFSCL